MRDEVSPEYGSPHLQRYEDGAVKWKILFSPEFSGHIFTCSEIMMDTVVTKYMKSRAKEDLRLLSPAFNVIV